MPRPSPTVGGDVPVHRRRGRDDAVGGPRRRRRGRAGPPRRAPARARSPSTGAACSPSDGDGFGVVFDDPQDAVDAAVAAQRALAAEPWPDGHAAAGPDGPRDGARRASATAATSARCRTGRRASWRRRTADRCSSARGRRRCSTASTLVDLGDHRLPDLPRAERLFQVFVDGAPSQFPAPRTSDAHRGNLPMPTTSLIGREQLLADVIELVRANRLVTLTGVGGVGKTRLAIEVGAVARRRATPTGSGWSSSPRSPTRPRCPTRSRPPWASRRQAGTSGDPDAGRGAVRTAGAGRARQLRARRRRGRRDRPRAARRGPRPCACSPRLGRPSTSPASSGGSCCRSTLDGGASSPAVTLFVERARALQSRIDFAEPDTAAAVVEICRSLDGLPLGIELAAARTISMSPIDIRDRLGDRFRILTASPRAPRRQQTLRDVVAWSYELLDDDERALLCTQRGVRRRLRPRRDHRGARGRTTTWRCSTSIDSLVRKSLVVADNAAGTARYVVLETIRQFAEDELADVGLDRRRTRPPRRPLRAARRPRAGRAGTARRGATASTGSRSSSPTSGPPSGGAGRAATSRPRPTSPRTPR